MADCENNLSMLTIEKSTELSQHITEQVGLLQQTMNDSQAAIKGELKDVKEENHRTNETLGMHIHVISKSYIVCKRIEFKFLVS